MRAGDAAEDAVRQPRPAGGAGQFGDADGLVHRRVRRDAGGQRQLVRPQPQQRAEARFQVAERPVEVRGQDGVDGRPPADGPEHQLRDQPAVRRRHVVPPPAVLQQVLGEGPGRDLFEQHLVGEGAGGTAHGAAPVGAVREFTWQPDAQAEGFDDGRTSFPRLAPRAASTFAPVTFTTPPPAAVPGPARTPGRSSPHTPGPRSARPPPAGRRARSSSPCGGRRRSRIDRGGDRGRGTR